MAIYNDLIPLQEREFSEFHSGKNLVSIDCPDIEPRELNRLLGSNS